MAEPTRPLRWWEVILSTIAWVAFVILFAMVWFLDVIARPDNDKENP